jgi:tetratricopeptide (TPR) repeat protein
VVSFNGKTFDIPLLNTRFVMARRQFPLRSVLHLDLLPPARRLWSARLPSCSLTSLEERILGFYREGDVPGWMIPSLYFDYARTGDGGPLAPVFTHNALDILSMVSLTTRMAECLIAPEVAGVSHGADWYSLGKCYERLGWTSRATDAYQQALSAPCAPTIRQRSYEQLSFLYKRQAMWDMAVELWEDLVKAHIAHRLYPYEELAKYYEHRHREYDRAIQLVQEAIARIDARELQPRRPRQRALAELQHRLQRLERKNAKQKTLQ